MLSNAGATAVVGSRDPGKPEMAAAKMKNVEVGELDLASPASIDRFASEFLISNRALDLLVDNAGVMATPLTRDERGYELQFSTNHLGHFQLAARLWPALKNLVMRGWWSSLPAVMPRWRWSDDPNFNKRPYDKWAAYGQSKAPIHSSPLNWTSEDRSMVFALFAVHPGGILTDLLEYMTDEELSAYGIYRENGVVKVPDVTKVSERFKTLEEGAATTIWCAVSPQLNGKGGVYCEDCDIAAMVPADSKLLSGVRPWAVDTAAAEDLRILSEKLTSVAAGSIA